MGLKIDPKNPHQHRHQVHRAAERPQSPFPHVVMVPVANAGTATLDPLAVSVTATGFTVALASAPAASQTAGTYGIQWAVST